MTDHIKSKHYINDNDKAKDGEYRLMLIARCALDDTDKEILRLRYVKFCDFGYIADTLGMAYATVIKRHKKALAVFQAIAQERANSV